MHVPDTHKETTLGVYERITPADSTSATIQESYRNRAENILRMDRRHYEKHAPLIRQQIDAAGVSLKSCVAWAGGHPKLEAKAGFQSITVVDAVAQMYEESDELLQELYGPVYVTYIQSAITPDLVRRTMCYCHTFIHFIEHLTHETACEMLIACQRVPVIIYGPNIAKAKDQNWFHFRPADHNTFWTGGALVDFLKKIGYETVSLTEIDEDYLIIAN